MIYEFYKYEDKHGKSSKAFEIEYRGESREFIFCNNPPKQRLCHCQGCGIKIPREVPRIKWIAAYYYGAGYYCMSCGLKLLERKKESFIRNKNILKEQIEKIQQLEQITKEVMEDEWYPKKMALGRLMQVVSEKPKRRYY